MQSKAKAAVVIPMYNASELVKKAIDSVKQQTFQDWICIIVDDQSQDDSYEIAKDLITGDERFVLYRKGANGGASAARNFGFRHVPNSCQYLYFLDSDDFLDPRALEILCRYLDEHQHVGAVASKYKVINTKTGTMENHFHRRWQPSFPLARPIPDNQPRTPFACFFCLSGAGPFFLIRRSEFEKTMGYDETLIAFNDVDMLCQLSLISEVHQIPELLYFKQKHRDSLTYHPNRPEAYKKLRQKWRELELPPDQRKVVDQARRHYYRVHLPLVSLKTSAKALTEAIRMRSRNKANWCIYSFRKAISLFTSDWRKSESNEIS